MDRQNILVLAPHTDDGELGCGASMARFAEEGHRVIYAAFSTCRRSLPPGMPPDTLEKEARSAVQELGVQPGDLVFFDYDVRNFPLVRQEILENLLELKKKYLPSRVFLPCTADIHQDHQVISAEGLRAFRHADLLGYEMPWNNFSFHSNAFIRVEGRHLEKKTAALEKYHSQRGRAYINSEFIYSLARVRGVQAGCGFAESFEMIRSVI